MLLYALVPVGVVALWRLDRPPWACDAECISNMSRLQTSSKGCIRRSKQVSTPADPASLPKRPNGKTCSEEFGDYPFQVLGINESKCSPNGHPRLSFCVRQIKQQFLLANCNVNITDHRIPCRRAGDPMTWYRGTQSITISGKNCIRWDSVSKPILSSKFDEYDAPSLLHGASATRSQGIHAHENYCRNPDNWRHGPWCIVEETAKGHVREACFKECAAYAEPEMCLAKMFFPYSISSASKIPNLPSVHGVPEDIRDLSDILDVPRIAQFIRRNRAMFTPTLFLDYVRHYQGDISTRLRCYQTGFAKKKDFPDLSDILDVPRIAQFIRRNRAMFTPTLFLDYVRHYQGDISTRLRCYQTGVQTRIAGPWIYTSTSSHPFPKHAIWLEEAFEEWSADFMDRERAWRGDGGPYYNLWRPCFLACEDTNIKCWPVSQDNYNRPRFPYYGPRNFDAKGSECVSPNYAYQILVMQNRLNKLDKNHFTYLQILREKFLMDINGTKRLRNIFAISRGNMMVSRRCFTLGDFLHGLDERARKEMAEENAQLAFVMSIGAGCFIETSRLEMVDYSACFRTCKCNKTIHAPEIFARKTCIGERKCNQRYSPEIYAEDEEDDEIRDFLHNSKNFSALFKDAQLSDTFSYQPLAILIISAFCIIIDCFRSLLYLDPLMHILISVGLIALPIVIRCSQSLMQYFCLL
uniref:Kringle domain-containing protein n=1 Tax=Ascaris lumbricoides TaxID=6252 RepID=A0A0M3IG26_ASCLU